MRKLLPKSCFYLLTGTIFYVKLDKAENISFSQLSLSVIFSMKMFYQTFMKTDSALPIKLLLELKPTKTDKLSCTKEPYIWFLLTLRSVCA
jgi:hypothetical protein